MFLLEAFLLGRSGDVNLEVVVCVDGIRAWSEDVES
jgi:hypothetical protein